MDDCLVIANEIMQKLHKVSKENDVPVNVLVNVGFDIFLNKMSADI